MTTMVDDKRARDDYARDDVSSGIMLDMLEDLEQQQEAMRDREIIEGLAKALGVTLH